MDKENCSLYNKDIKDLAYYRTKKKLDINGWIIVFVLLVFLVAQISISEWVGNHKVILTSDSVASFKKVDNVLMPLFAITFFVALFADGIAGVKVIRSILFIPFIKRLKWVMVKCNSGQEIEIPVKNEEEAIRVIDLLKGN